MRPWLFLLLVLMVAAHADYVKRSLFISGTPDSRDFIQLLSDSYAYSERDVRIDSRVYPSATESIVAPVDYTILPATIENFVHVPMALYGVGIAYNTFPPAPPNDMGMFIDFYIDPDMMRNIWTGVIDTWEHPDLQSLNGYAKIPTGPIMLVVRCYDDAVAEYASITGLFGRFLSSLDPDGFGATYALNQHNLTRTLLDYNNESRVAIIGAEDERSLADLAVATNASFTYDLWNNIIAHSEDLQRPIIINRAGGFVTVPQSSSLVSAAINSADENEPINSLGFGSWPITGIYYGVSARDNEKSDCSYLETLLAMLSWSQINEAVSDDIDTVLGFTASLPSTMERASLSQIGRITCNGRTSVSNKLFLGGGRSTRLINNLGDAFDGIDNRQPLSIITKYSDVDVFAMLSQVHSGDLDFGLIETSSVVPPVAMVNSDDFVAVPFARGSIVPVYNIPDVPFDDFYFSPQTVISILHNETTYWDDVRIVQDNPLYESVLPHEKIAFVADAGGSFVRSGGPAGGFNNQLLYAYLCSVDPTFNATVWQTGGAIIYPISYIKAGDAGVSSTVASTPYSLGFDQLSTALDSRTVSRGTISDRRRRQVSTDPLYFDIDLVILKDQLPNRDAKSVAILLEWIYWSATQAQSIFDQLGFVPIISQDSDSDSDPDVVDKNLIAQILSRITLGSDTAFVRSSCIAPNGLVCSSQGNCQVDITTLNAQCECDDFHEGRFCQFTKSSSSESGGNDSSLAIGIGTGVGSLVLVLCVCLLVAALLVIRRLHAKIRHTDRIEWHVNSKEFEIERAIGSGGYGTVYEGMWKSTPVAIKVLEFDTPVPRVMAIKEIDIMSRMRHPNIVLFMAASIQRERIHIVMEYLKLGSLCDLLHNELIPDIPLAIGVRNFMFSIVKGLGFLHSSGVVHRDLKSANILLDEKWNVKITDFGLSAFVHNSHGKTRDAAEAGSVPWMAPEVLLENLDIDYYAADVYSLGVVFWEVLTREMPYMHMFDDPGAYSTAAVAVSVIRDDVRPHIDLDGMRSQNPAFETEIEDLVELVQKCWSRDPSLRPSIMDMTEKLRQIDLRIVENGGRLTNGSRSSTGGDGTMAIHSSSVGSSSLDSSVSHHHPDGTCTVVVKSAEQLSVARGAPDPMDGDVTFVAVDMVGALHLWQQDVDAAYDATTMFNSAVRRCAAKRNGYESRPSSSPLHSGVGGFCFAFHYPRDAFLFACELQHELLAIEWPDSVLAIHGNHRQYGNTHENVLINAGPRARIGIDVGAARMERADQSRRAIYSGPVCQNALVLTLMPNSGHILMTERACTHSGALQDDDCATVKKLRVTSSSPYYEDASKLGVWLIVPKGLELRLTDPVPWTTDDDDDDNEEDNAVDAYDYSGIRQMREMYGLDYFMSANHCRWLNDSKNIVKGGLIGGGATANVFRGKWNNSRKVAIKEFKNAIDSEKNMLKFRREMALSIQLSHPNVVIFIGTCMTDENRFCIIMELMSNGSLRDVLDAPAKHDLRWTTRLRYAIGAAQGLCYLHEKDILHRDVKSSNILIDSESVAKISDFGFSCVRKGMRTASLCGTPAWMAPEVINREVYTEKSDVYSFGMVLWELLTTHVPFANVNMIKCTMDILDKKRPKIPKDCPDDYAKLLKKCWHHQPERRPTMNQVKNKLYDILRQCDSTEYDEEAAAPI